jgi:hypothetical protein
VQVPAPSRPTPTLKELKVLARSVIDDGEAALFELEWAATAFVAEGAKAALMAAGRRLEELVQRLREGL